MKTILFTLIFFAFAHALFAQQDSARTNRLQAKLSINYNSNLHYYGRTDSLRSSGSYPMAELWLGDSWYVNAAPIFVHNRLTGTDYAGTVATMGYLNISEKAITHVYALKPFYTPESRLVQAALKAQAGLSVTALSSVANLSLGGDVKYSNAVDLGAQASLDHVIRKEWGGSVLVIDPTLSVQGGTQRFLTTYRRKKGMLLPREEVVTEEKQAFRVLAWEASVPLIFSRGPVQLLATPAYVVPQNLLPGEWGKPLAYLSAGVKYSF